MTRYLCWLAVLGLVVLPDWASACWPGGGGQRAMYAEPMYPMYVPPPVYVYPQVWQPAPMYVVPPQRIEPIPKMATPAPAPPSGTGMGVVPPPPAPPRTQATEPIRPAFNQEIPTAPAKAEAPKKVDPPKQVTPPATVQESLPKFPTVEIPSDIGPLPKLELPTQPDFRPVQTPTPAPNTPAVETPKNPAIELPKNPPSIAIPDAAPALPEPLIPPSSLPVMPNPAKSEALPSLTLPPEMPVAPKADSTSRSSPLTGGEKRDVSVKVSAVGGTVDPTGYKAVRFANHTARDLSLTIEGRTVTLPAKTYRDTKLGPNFTWGYANGTPVRERVAAETAGLEVVFRE